MEGIKNIIFDFGGVIIDIDYHRCIDSFEKLLGTAFDQWYSQKQQAELFDALETGNISEEEFYESIRNAFRQELTDEQIREAWNSILIRLPEENVALLKRLKQKYRLFLLSNTNIIHERAFRELIERQ